MTLLYTLYFVICVVVQALVGSRIYFPNELANDCDGMQHALGLRLNVNDNHRSCNPFMYEVFYPPSGRCEALLHQGPCPLRHWLVIDKHTGKAKCAPKRCRPRDIFFNGVCYDKHIIICPISTSLITNEFGEAECDCKLGTIYYPKMKTCYSPYTQGPCDLGYILKVINKHQKRTVECVENPCKIEHSVLMDKNCKETSLSRTSNSCFQMHSTGPCTNGNIILDPFLLEPACFDIELHSLLSILDTSKCPKGSKRDLSERCREGFKKGIEKQEKEVNE